MKLIDATPAEAQKMLTDYLEQMRKLRATGRQPEGFVYSCREDFLLQHGKFYDPVEWIGPRGAPKACFANSLLGAVRSPKRFRYVEGYALTGFGFPTAHGWMTDPGGKGRAFDPTWHPAGLAYFGVEFANRRAWQAQWDGDGSVLDDWQHGHPILRQTWKGEDWNKWLPLSFREVCRKAGLGPEV